MNVLDRLISYKNDHDEGSAYYQIVNLLLEQINVIKNSTIYEAAELCFTSTASIGRLCKILGYSGYSEFRFKLSEVLDNYAYFDNPLPVSVNTITALKAETCNVLKQQADWLSELEDNWLESITDFIKMHNHIYFFDFAHFPESVRILSINLILDHKAFTYCSNQEQQEALFRKAATTKNPLLIFVVPNIVSTSSVLSLYQKAVTQNQSTFLLKSSTSDSCTSFHADIKHPILSFPGYATSVDAISRQLLWTMIAVIYRKKYIDFQFDA